MSGASRWLDATPKRTAPATRPAPSPTRTSSFLVMQAPFDDRLYAARDRTDVCFDWRSNSFAATLHHEDTKDTKDARRSPPQRKGGHGGFERKQKRAVNTEITEIAECRSSRRGAASNRSAISARPLRALRSRTCT